MWKNYLKIALRHLRRQKGYAFINISGLAVGLVACLLIGLYVRHELTYDQFHEQADRLYRVLWDTGWGGSGLVPAAASRSFEELAGVEQSVRLQPTSKVVTSGAEPVREENIYYADASFFEVFTFPLASGNPETALAEPNTAVLTRQAARRYVGDEHPIGQTLTLRDGTTLRVTGLLEELPSNSHLQFNILISFETLARDGQISGFDHQSHTYLLLQEADAAASVQAGLDRMTRGGIKEMQQRLGFAVEDMGFELQSVTDIHLRAGLGGAVQPEGSLQAIYIVGAVGLFILLIAMVNYMNLATASSIGRVREIGVRKTLGARRRQLAVQFLSESVLTTLLAFVLALLLAPLGLPLARELTGTHFQLDLTGDPAVLGLFLLGALLVGLVSGSYPALVMSRFLPAPVLKGNAAQPLGGRRLRQGLIVFQFVVSVGLIISTLVVQDQLQYLHDKPRGYDSSQVITLPILDEHEDRLETIKREFGQLPGVESVSTAWDAPTSYISGQFEHDGRPITATQLPVDHDYLETMGMELIAGRNFDPERASDSTRAIIVNETAARVFDLTDKVGEPLTFDLGARSPRLIGIVSDFHTASLHHPIRPTVLNIRPQRYRHFLIRLDGGDLSETLPALESRWNAFTSDYPFTYEFLDETLQARYEQEARLLEAFSVFTALAVLLACMGLFALSTFMTSRRTKEIGVRKVLGATATNIVTLLSKDFLKLVACAVVIAIPLAYLAMEQWLQEFTYRVDVGTPALLTAGLVAILTAFLTVSFHSIKAALTNPADSLRYE